MRSNIAVMGLAKRRTEAWIASNGMLRVADMSPERRSTRIIHQAKDERAFVGLKAVALVPLGVGVATEYVALFGLDNGQCFGLMVTFGVEVLCLETVSGSAIQEIQLLRFREIADRIELVDQTFTVNCQRV